MASQPFPAFGGQARHPAGCGPGSHTAPPPTARARGPPEARPSEARHKSPLRPGVPQLRLQPGRARCSCAVPAAAVVSAAGTTAPSAGRKQLGVPPAHMGHNSQPIFFFFLTH